jgi:hypothetical protein
MCQKREIQIDRELAAFIRELERPEIQQAEAEQARERAKQSPPDSERDAQMKRGREVEIIDRWLSSSELKPPN